MQNLHRDRLLLSSYEWEIQLRGDTIERGRRYSWEEWEIQFEGVGDTVEMSGRYS